MKVFYAVQVSNFTKDKGGRSKWLIRNDACMNIAVGLIKCMLDVTSGVQFVLKVPRMQDCIDIKCSFGELFDNNSEYLSRITFYEEDIPISPVDSRYNFNFAFHKEKFPTDIDVMINDENTLTKNWNALFASLSLNIPIISTNYFLDSPLAKKVPERIRYYERQMESFINSDIAAFQCKAGMDEALAAYDLLFKDRSLIKNTSVWGIGCHAKEIMKYHTATRLNIPTIYFGNRITDSAGRYTNWDAFAEAIGVVYEKYGMSDFQAIMLNPTRKVSDSQMDEIKTLSKGRVTVMSNDDTFSRDEYLKFINHAHISCNLFTTEVHGGVTHAEALLAGNLVVMPYVNNYRDKLEAEGYGRDYPFSCEVTKDQKVDIDSLASAIVIALNTLKSPDYRKWSKVCFDLGYNHESYECAVHRILTDLFTLVEMKKERN